MKKRWGVLSLILVLALLVGAVFALVITAQGATEAELTVTTVVTEGETSTSLDTKYSGTYDEMVAKLNSELALGEGTTYTLNLLSDAKASVTLEAAGTESQTVMVKLGGNTLTADTDSPLFSIGKLERFRLDGEYDLMLRRGEIASAKDAPVLVAGNDADAEIGDVIISTPALKSAPAITQNGGSLILRNTEILYTGDGISTSDTVSLIEVNNGAWLKLWGSSVTDTSDAVATEAIAASGAILRLERSVINTDTAVYTGGSVLTIIDTEINADTAFTTAALAADKVYLGGVTLRAADITAGALTAAEVEAWYGTGSTVIEHKTPLDELTVKGSTTALSEVENGKWTLLNSATTAAMTTAFADGAAPVETKSTLANCLKVFQAAAPATPTTYTMSLLSDWTISGSSAPLTNGNRNSTVFVDFNGHNIRRTTKGANIFTASGENMLSIDGADALGNKSTLTSITNNGAFLYNTNSLEFSRVALTDINLVWTNQSTSSSKSPMLQMVAGYCYFDGLNMVYNGKDFPTDGSGTAATITMIRGQSQAKIFVTDCDFDGTNSVDMKTMALVGSSGTSSVRAKDVRINTTTAASTSSSSGVAASVHIADSVVVVSGVPYSMGRTSAPITVVDTSTTMAGAKLASGAVYFPYGSGKNIVKTDAPSLEGTQVYDEGFKFAPAAEVGVYEMIDESAITSVKLNQIFGNGMVLQAGEPINVFGTCKTPGAAIKVTIGDNTATTTVGADGKWHCTLAAMTYQQGVTMTIDELGLKHPTTTVSDIDIGEIWLMSGQSNSVYGVNKMEDFAEYKANADNFDNIRAYAVSQAQSLLEKDVATASGWYQVTSSTLNQDDRYTGISAIAYVMATRLASELGSGVTIGILDVNFNGSTVEAWMSEKNLAECSDTDYYNKYKAYKDYYLANGTYPTEADVAGYGDYVASGKLYQGMGCGTYNAMIAPYAGFTIGGAIWYQGEGNSSRVTATADGYTACFNGVRKTFREAFSNEDLPVFIIQIPPYMSNPVYFRQAQYNIAAADDNTYLVASSTSGSTFSKNELKYTGPTSDRMVHYERKSPMGLAVANSILENIYFKDKGLDISAPNVLSVTGADGAIKIVFDRELSTLYGTKLEGFEIAGNDGTFVAAVAVYDKATKSVTLTAAGVSEPTTVRYGFGKSILILEDGTELVYNLDNTKFAYDEATGIVTITTADNKYVIDSNDPAVIGAKLPGNVIAANGTSLPSFRLTVE